MTKFWPVTPELSSDATVKEAKREPDEWNRKPAPNPQGTIFLHDAHPTTARQWQPKNAAKSLDSAASGLDFLIQDGDTACMRNLTKFSLLAIVTLISVMAFNQTAAAPSSSAPEYTKDGQIKFPENYREWVYLSTGFDMSYTQSRAADHHMFDSVFVNPEAYKSFVQTGTWPDKTMLALEVRGAKSKGSINQSGSYQDTELMGVELHVKDVARFPGKWAFFGIGEGNTGRLIPQSADCYSCHAAHGAVDTTFVQFYPTLLPVAKAKGTLSAEYQKESKAGGEN